MGDTTGCCIAFSSTDAERQAVLTACQLAKLPTAENSEPNPRAPMIWVLGERASSLPAPPGIPDLVIRFPGAQPYHSPGARHLEYTGSLDALAKQLSEWFFTRLSAAPIEINMVGKSWSLTRLTRLIKRTAATAAPVFIKGETGTGKEVAARAIHYLGERQDYPFVPVNCGAYTDELFASEFFGYERGAFTDAKQARAGFVEQAEGGTLFLDEVDSLSPKAQVTLLRFLQDRRYRRLGGRSTRQADVRILAASNRDMTRLVGEQRFREDLYYRLDILALDIPPLRERIGDLPLLCDHFLDRFSRQYDRPPKHLSPDTLAWMSRYSWPGNIRELENYLHKVFVLAETDEIHVDTIKGTPSPSYGVTEAPQSATDARVASTKPEIDLFHLEKKRVIRNFEKHYLHKVLSRCSGNISQAARMAGKERRSFTRLVEKHGLRREEYTDQCQ